MNPPGTQVHPWAHPRRKQNKCGLANRPVQHDHAQLCTVAWTLNLTLTHPPSQQPAFARVTDAAIVIFFRADFVPLKALPG